MHAKGTKLAALDRRHKIIKANPVPCNVKGGTFRVNPIPFGYQVQIHSSCFCNELVALHNRHLVDRTYIPFDKRLWQTIARETRNKFYNFSLDKDSLGDVVNCYSGAKKKRYIAALAEYMQFGLLPKHSVVHMFIKPDRYDSEEIINKAPRAIQYRDPCFNLLLSQFTKPMERALYHELTFNSASNTRVIAKGLNNYERAEIMLEKVSYFSNPVYLEIDHSKFDSTINTTHLHTTHAKYYKMFEKGGVLSQLCRAQLRNKGYSKNGIKYKTTGTRMSGDADTALGNTIVNLDCLYGFLKLCGITKYDMLVDGDDSVVIIESANLHLIDTSYFGRLGFDTKFKVVINLQDVEFCQCKLILSERPCYVRNPLRVLSHTQFMRVTPVRIIEAKEWVTSVGLCEEACNDGVPVINQYAISLMHKKIRPRFEPEYLHRYSQHKHKEMRPITMEARESMERAWSISIPYQIMLEKYFTQLRPLVYRVFDALLSKDCPHLSDWLFMSSIFVIKDAK